MNSCYRTLLIFCFVFVLGILVWENFIGLDNKDKQITFSNPPPHSAATPTPSRESIIKQIIEENHIHVKWDTMETIDTNTVTFKEETKMERIPNYRENCLHPAVNAYNKSSEFNCATFEKRAKPVIQERTIYFDKLCSPTITINTKDQSIRRQILSRCSFFEYENREGGDWVCLPSYVTFSAAKTGTTTLFHSMSSHPNIQFYAPKEPNFFSTRFDPPTGGDPIDYLQLMCNTTIMFGYNVTYLDKVIEEARLTNSIPTLCSPIICGDHSTQYTSEAMTSNLGQMKLSLPNLKFIQLMREPISRMESDVNFFAGWIHTAQDYANSLSNNIAKAKRDVNRFNPEVYTSMSEEQELFPFTDLELCLRAEEEIPLFFSELKGAGVPVNSMYWIALYRFFEVFDPADLYIAFTEHLNHPDTQQQILADVFAFVGVPPFQPDMTPQNVHSNQYKLHFFNETRRKLTEILKPHTIKLQQFLGWENSDFPGEWQYLL